jgi:hypothetical protein
MREKFLLIAAAFALSTPLVLSGCKSSTPAPAPAAPAQSASPDGSAAPAAPPPAGSPNSAAAPNPNAAPAVAPGTPAPAPVAAAPAPPPEPVKLTAPAGASVVVTVTEQLSASKNNVGDTFSGVLAQPVKTSTGATVLPRGARVMGTVIAAKGQGKFKGSGALGIQVTSIGGHSVSTSAYEKEQKGKGKRTAGMIGGGAGGGALIGGLAGGGKGALIGGLIGAGAGTAGAAFTGNKDVVIPSESNVTFRLTAPVTITVQPKEAAEPPPAR